MAKGIFARSEPCDRKHNLITRRPTDDYLTRTIGDIRPPRLTQGPPTRRPQVHFGTAGNPDAAADPDAPADDPRHAADCRHTRNYLWAELMRRSLGLDVLACPRCDGRLTLTALIEDTAVIAPVLRHLGLPTDMPEA